MSQMARELAQHRPDWPAVPEELERAWSWMEDQGYGRASAAGYVLSPYPGDSGPAPAFLSTMSLEGWFEPGSLGHARLLPIAEAAGDGSAVALWRDDDDDVRVVVLESEGCGYMIAEDVRALLALLSVGYIELTEMYLGEPPEDGLADEALSPWRSWMTYAFGVSAPQEWPAVGDDEFSAWLDFHLGTTQSAAEPLAESATCAVGEVENLLDLLGEPDGPEVCARLAGLTGAKLKDRLRSSGAALRRVGLEAESNRHGVSTLWIRMADRPFGPIVKQQAPSYPRPAALIEGLSAESTREDVLAVLGKPEREGPSYLRYVVQGRYLHLEFDDGGLVRVTLMVDVQG
jgi:hypothetical protein